MRAYAVASSPRPKRKTARFRCHHCGQKVLVDRALRRAAISCPRCKQLVPAPQRGRLWLELCGGAILFLAGLTIGHTVATKAPLPVPASATVLPNGASEKKAAKTQEPKPAWFAKSQADD